MTKLYNLYFATQMDTFNIMGLTENKLEKVITAYKGGQTEFTLSGKKYWIDNIHEFLIFTHEHKLDPVAFEKEAKRQGYERISGGMYYLNPEALEMAGKNVTDEIIGDAEFGIASIVNAMPTATLAKIFVEVNRIEELKNVSNSNFDLTRLIRFCEEINANYSNENYLSVAMLGRSIINHIPPIFGFATFADVCSQYGGASFKKIASHLNFTMRGIADSFLHDKIRMKESLPNSTQVNFAQDLDVLLAEIVRKLNEETK